MTMDVRCYLCGAILTEEDWGPECTDCLFDGFWEEEDPYDGELWEKIDDD